MIKYIFIIYYKNKYKNYWFQLYSILLVLFVNFTCAYFFQHNKLCRLAAAIVQLWTFISPAPAGDICSQQGAGRLLCACIEHSKAMPTQAPCCDQRSPRGQGRAIARLLFLCAIAKLSKPSTILLCKATIFNRSSA